MSGGGDPQGHGRAVEPLLPAGPEVGVQEGDVRWGGTFDGIAVAQDGPGVGRPAAQHVRFTLSFPFTVRFRFRFRFTVPVRCTVRFRFTVHGATTAFSAQGPNALRRSAGSR